MIDMKFRLAKLLIPDILNHNKYLEDENKKLKEELYKCGHIFFEEQKYLGYNNIAYGVLIEGEPMQLKIVSKEIN